MLLGKGDIRTTFCIVVFCIVLLILGQSDVSYLFFSSTISHDLFVTLLLRLPTPIQISHCVPLYTHSSHFHLAYLTNPSENSFRAYLTEQSFRQHLSRLDDNTDDDHVTQDELRSHYSLPGRGGPNSYHTRAFDSSSPFHFANRASVSLRTPKHVFHSFGIFTIAAMVPLAKSDGADSHRSSNDRDGSMISDSWFIGAFGQWWRGGVIESWYQDVVSRSNDEESWSSGILGMKTLDKVNEYNGVSYWPHMS